LVTLLGEPKKYGVLGDREEVEEKPAEPKKRKSCWVGSSGLVAAMSKQNR
jgi:hypothetical protein